jgi:hypothetical protein
MKEYIIPISTKKQGVNQMKNKIAMAVFERAYGLYFCCNYNDTITLEGYGLPFKWSKECMN